MATVYVEYVAVPTRPDKHLCDLVQQHQQGKALTTVIQAVHWQALGCSPLMQQWWL
jgi:hypothetical protein